VKLLARNDITAGGAIRGKHIAERIGAKEKRRIEPARTLYAPDATPHEAAWLGLTVEEAMAMAYPGELKDVDLPLTVTDPEAVRKFEMLLVARPLRARLRRAGTCSMPHRAIFHEVTAEGLAVWGQLEAGPRL
jgi:hypothetical protein